MSTLLDKANALIIAAMSLRDDIAQQQGTPTPAPPTPAPPTPAPPTPAPPAPSNAIRLPRGAPGTVRRWEGDINEAALFVFNSGTGTMGRITLAEYRDQPVQRHGVMTAVPGGPPLSPMSDQWGVTLAFDFFVGPVDPRFPTYPALTPNTDYFLLVNPEGGPGHVFIDLK